MRVLLVILSEDSAIEGHLLPLASFASAYYVFRDASIDLVLASRMGGYLFLDHSAPNASAVEASIRRFQSDRAARDDLADTICFDDAHAEDFDAAMCIGTPGDDTAPGLPDRVLFLMSSLLAFGKPVAVIPQILAPRTGNGLLITGDSANAPLLAANALIGALKVVTAGEEARSC
jgi:hypothetical protein